MNTSSFWHKRATMSFAPPNSYIWPRYLSHMKYIITPLTLAVSGEQRVSFELTGAWVNFDTHMLIYRLYYINMKETISFVSVLVCISQDYTAWRGSIGLKIEKFELDLWINIDPIWQSKWIVRKVRSASIFFLIYSIQFGTGKHGVFTICTDW